MGLFKGAGREIGTRKQQRGDRREKGEARELLVSVLVGVGGEGRGRRAAARATRCARGGGIWWQAEWADRGGGGGGDRRERGAALGWYWVSPAPEAAIVDGQRRGCGAGAVGAVAAGTLESERVLVLVSALGQGQGEEGRERRGGGMKRGKGGRNGLLPSSLRIISSCLKTVTSNAGSVASTVRSAGASVAASISSQAEDEKDQVHCPAPASTSSNIYCFFPFFIYAARADDCGRWGLLTLVLCLQFCILNYSSILQ